MPVTMRVARTMRVAVSRRVAPAVAMPMMVTAVNRDMSHMAAAAVTAL
jgi:hypothetical protein